MADLVTQSSLISQYLSARVAEQNIRSANIANLDTPQYKAKVPEFETLLKNNVNGEKEWSIDMKVGVSQETAREDGNNVQLEKEMGALAENQVLFQSALKILNKNLAFTRYAVTGQFN